MDTRSFDANVHTVVEPSPSQAAIDKVLDIVERAITASIPLAPDEFSPRWTNFIRFAKRHQRKLIWAAAALMMASALLFLMSWYLDRQILLIAAVITALLAEVCGVLYVGADVATGVPFLQGMLKRPHAEFLKMLRITTTFDLGFLRELGACELAAVQHVHRHCQFHRMGMERRGGAFSGSIDKIGIFPAIAALALLWIQFYEVASPFGIWLRMLVPLIFLFHLMNLFSLVLQIRQDRIIALLDASIATRKK